MERAQNPGYVRAW